MHLTASHGLLEDTDSDVFMVPFKLYHYSNLQISAGVLNEILIAKTGVDTAENGPLTGDTPHRTTKHFAIE